MSKAPIGCGAVPRRGEAVDAILSGSTPVALCDRVAGARIAPASRFLREDRVASEQIVEERAAG